MRWRWAAILFTVSQAALAGCDDPPMIKEDVVIVTASSLIAQSNRLNDDLSDPEREALIESLSDAVDADPVMAADRFERDIGGEAALGRYARGMVDAGQAERLGRQVAVVLRDGDRNSTIAQALSVSVPRDGSTWFRAAEKAGFFAAGVAGALDGGGTSSASVFAFARAMGGSAPGRTSSAREWLRACGADEGCELNGAAQAAYERAFDRGAR